MTESNIAVVAAVDPSDYASENHDRTAYFILDAGKEPAARIASELGLEIGTAYFGVRVEAPTTIDQSDPRVARKGDLLLFEEDRLMKLPDAFVGFVAAADQSGGLARSTYDGRRIVGLDADIRMQFDALLKHEVRDDPFAGIMVPGTERHLRDLAVLAPYAREAVDKAIESPTRARFARAVGIKARFAVHDAETR